MFEILSLVLPFFAVIGCGYFGARLINETQQDGINNLVLYFALPVLIFSLMARSEIASRFQPDFVSAYLAVSLLLFVLAFLLIRMVYQSSRSDTAIFAMGAIYGNTGYMGIPIIVISLGNEASVPVVISLILDVMIMIPVSVAVLESGRGDVKGSLLNGVVKALIATFRNPLIIAALLGIVWSISELPMPVMLDGFLNLLGAAAAPCALFALGASLYGKPIGSTLSPSLLVSGFKLVVHPLLLWYAMTQIWHIDPAWAHPALLGAAMPVAATVYVVARQYHTMITGASTAILVSTGLSLVSYPAVIIILEHFQIFA